MLTRRAKKKKKTKRFPHGRNYLTDEDGELSLESPPYFLPMHFEERIAVVTRRSFKSKSEYEKEEIKNEDIQLLVPTLWNAVCVLKNKTKQQRNEGFYFFVWLGSLAEINWAPTKFEFNPALFQKKDTQRLEWDYIYEFTVTISELTLQTTQRRLGV